jgi:hypothetical protein
VSRLLRIRRRLLHECRDLLELVLLPGLAAVLPWPLCFRVFRRLAHWRWLYRDVCEQAVRQARACGVVDDEAHWHWMRRLVTLVDHADFYLSHLRGRARARRWLARRVCEEGAWPPPDRAAILCTFHWGAGLWGLHGAARAGLHAHMLVTRPAAQAFQGRAVRAWYVRLRIQEITRVLGYETLDVSAPLRQVIRALRAGQQIVAVVDVPADQVAASEPVTVMNMPARIPRGLLRLAVDRGVPVTVYLSGFDVRTGRHQVRIKPLGVYDDLQVLIGDVFRHLDEALAQEPAAWHFWSEARRFFVA